MQVRPPRSVKTDMPEHAGLSTKKLSMHVDEWLADCDWREHSPSTISLNKMIAMNLVWFLRDKGYETVDKAELRAFFGYVKHGHTDPRGRWAIRIRTRNGADRGPRFTKPISSRTALDYFSRVRTFFRWLVKQRYIDISPVEMLDAPIHRKDQKQPFNDSQFDALLKATKSSLHPIRDEAILWLLYDVGIRSTELCMLQRSDLDMGEHCVRVKGKGGKDRTVYFGKAVTKVLWLYLRDMEIPDDEPLFQCESGSNKGGALNKDTMRLMFKRLQKKGDIHGIRCSPHTMRHTHALEYLRAGGTIEELQHRLGHTDLTMTMEYVKLARADLPAQARFSPADRKKRRASK